MTMTKAVALASGCLLMTMERRPTTKNRMESERIRGKTRMGRKRRFGVEELELPILLNSPSHLICLSGGVFG